MQVGHASWPAAVLTRSHDFKHIGSIMLGSNWKNHKHNVACVFIRKPLFA